jgi:hypothetical protein
MADESVLDQLIANQRSAVRYHLLFAIGIAALGVAVILASLVLSDKVEVLKGEGLKTLLSIGGGFVSSLSAFQIKGIVRRKENIGVFTMLKARLRKLTAQGAAVSQPERARIEELIWKVVEKTALG